MTTAIGRDELKAKLDRGDKFRLVETLASDEFQRSHLPGATNLPPDQIEAKAAQILPDRQQEVVVYCGSATCNASEDAARDLEAQGYKQVRRYVGGKKDWIAAGLPIESASPITAG
jgi:rhodanese-related sulfurtransferase